MKKKKMTLALLREAVELAKIKGLKKGDSFVIGSWWVILS